MTTLKRLFKIEFERGETGKEPISFIKALANTTYQGQYIREVYESNQQGPLRG